MRFYALLLIWIFTLDLEGSLAAHQQHFPSHDGETPLEISSDSDTYELDSNDADYSVQNSNPLQYKHENDSPHLARDIGAHLIVGSKEWNTFRQREIRARRKARGMKPGDVLERLPPVPGYEHLRGGARTTQRAIWLGLSGQGRIAKDLRRIDSPVFVRALEMREANPDLMDRESLIQAALALEEEHKLKPGQYSSRILPDYTQGDDGEWHHNPVGIYYAPRIRRPKNLTGDEIKDDADLPSSSSIPSSSREGGSSLSNSRSNQARKMATGKSLTNAQTGKRSRERRKRLGIPLGQPLPKLPLIPPELRGYPPQVIIRLNLEMLAIGKEGKRAPDLNLLPTTIIWNAYWKHRDGSDRSLRNCLRTAAIEFETEHGLEPGDFSDHILADFEDGSTRPTGVSVLRQTTDRGVSRQGICLADVLSELNLEQSNESDPRSKQLSDAWMHPPRQKRTHRLPVGLDGQVEWPDDYMEDEEATIDSDHALQSTSYAH